MEDYIWTIIYILFIMLISVVGAWVSRIIKKANSDFNFETYLSFGESTFIAFALGLVVSLLFIDGNIATIEVLLNKISKPTVVAMLAGYQAPRIFILSEKTFKDYIKKKIKDGINE